MDEQSLQKWANHIRSFRLPVIKMIFGQVNISGHILEIGSGSCWLSAIISQKTQVKEIVAVEIDKNKLELANEFFIHNFGGNKKKINTIVADFHNLPFPNEYFDLITCDAALHHSKNLPILLKELYRVLKCDGKLVAIREPVLPSLPCLRIVKKKLFGLKQKKQGNIENVYTLNEWKRYFDESGFESRFIKYTLTTTLKEKLINIVKKSNGLLFNRTYIIASKQQGDYGKRKNQN